MLGWINISVKLFVIETFGEDKWKIVAERISQSDWLSDNQVPCIPRGWCITSPCR